MTQRTVNISAALSPDPVNIASGDSVVWNDHTTAVQTVTSNDGQTFTTGPIQPGSNSLPIAVPASSGYTIAPAGLHGNVVVN